MKLLTYGIVALSMFVCATLAPHAQADEWNKKTIFKFSEPVEIPGQTLAAGTYVFKLLDSQADRHIVQIFNKNEDHLYATVLAVPDYRMHATGKTILTFEERAAGAPQAIQAWFYPGDRFGDEFVYPKAKAVVMAKQYQKPVPSMGDEQTANTTEPAPDKKAPSVTAMEKAPLKVQKPEGGETEVAEVYETAPQQTAQNNPPAQPPMRNELPKTAGNLGTIELAGLISLAAALALNVRSRRMVERR